MLPSSLPQPIPQLPFDIVCDSLGDESREAWLAARAKTIGASEAAAVFSMSPWASLLELWAVKTGRMEPKSLDDKETVFWGQILEPGIIEGFGKRTGHSVVPFGILLRSTRYPVLSATPDALCTDDPEAAKLALRLRRTIIRIRALLRKDLPIGDLAQQLAEYSKGWWPLQVKNIGFTSAQHWDNGIPPYYQIQCTQEALVWGATRCTGAALVAGQQLVWDHVEAKPGDLLPTQIVNLTRRFWDTNICMGISPPPDASESARLALAALYPKELPELVLQLGMAELELARERDELKERIKADEARTKQIDNDLRAAMGHASKCFLPDGSGFTLNTTNKKAYAVEASSYRTLLRKPLKQKKEE